MLIDINKIIISDRIRQDFGNIEELANDIKENGLINPPVVTPIQDGQCKLLAGERRIRAMKSLGYQQVEVRPMAVRDAEHQLDIEIAENAIRKDWTMTEMLEIARRKERMSAIKAKENQARKDGSVSSNLTELVDSRKDASEVIGVSTGQYSKMKTIEDNRNLLDPSDFADWDEGRLSTNKAFQKVKAERDRLKRESEAAIQTAENLSLLVNKYPELEDFIEGGMVDKDLLTSLLNGMSSADKDEFLDMFAKEKIVDNTDYELKEKQQALLRQIKDWESSHEKDMELLSKERKKNQELNKELEKYKENDPDSKRRKMLKDNALMFCSRINTFIQDVGGYVWLTDHINELDELDRSGFIRAINAIGKWADTMEYNINKKEMEIK